MAWISGLFLVMVFLILSGAGICQYFLLDALRDYIFPTEMAWICELFLGNDFRILSRAEICLYFLLDALGG